MGKFYLPSILKEVTNASLELGMGNVRRYVSRTIVHYILY
jgi:hypothetical protein